MILPERIKKARVTKGLTQQQCAEAMGVSLTSWQNWESGAKPPSQLRHAALSEFLGASVDWLKGGAGPGVGYPRPSRPDVRVSRLREDLKVWRAEGEALYLRMSELLDSLDYSSRE